ncbi:hypothetical protein [Dyella sp. C11]|uniref:hypothetical protein n=1 Tax=Dyella sp. C11 TaxID=2126991 RepID=UPI0013006EAB|nr:hypothetical protein [Dyella sp. C11]
MGELDPRKIYAGQIRQASARLAAALRFHSVYVADKDVPSLDAAVLQIRKALELIAFAAIAPDKEAFLKVRASDEAGKFTRDFHARKFLLTLDKVNPDFYPLALTGPTRKEQGMEFGRKETGYLTRDRFEKVYDRLGKHLHAQNPWGSDPNIQNLAKDIPSLVEEIYQLIELHARIVRRPGKIEIWVWQTDRQGGMPAFLEAIADGDLIDTKRKSRAGVSGAKQ